MTDPETPANSSYHTFVYDQKNRLKTVTVSGTSTTYGYDGNDRRVTITPPTGVTKLQLYSQEGQFLYEIRPSTGTGQNTYLYLGRHLLARVGPTAWAAWVASAARDRCSSSTPMVWGARWW